MPKLGLAENQKTVLELAPAIPNHNTASPAMMGMLGLNTVPTARMDKVGTVRLGASTSDPYVHSFIGFQLAKPLYINFRQTAEKSGLLDKTDNRYPGIDVNLRLMEETATRPAVVLGIDSAVGRKRLASEYLAFSKRYNNFDLTGGIAWGALGSAGHITNPMRGFSSHFDKRRNYNSDFEQSIHDWFTGKEIGFFGGVEYFTPIEGLSLKADYGANDYIGEQQSIDGFDAPAPWSVGLNYNPKKYLGERVDISAGIVGGEKIMVRLSLQDQLFNWPGNSYAKNKAPDLLSPRPKNKAKDEETEDNPFSFLSLFSTEPIARQIGRQARISANEGDFELESLEIKTSHKGLSGPSVTLVRHDLERAILSAQGSPEEIWQDTNINKNGETFSNSFAELFKKNSYYRHSARFILDNKFSFSEPDIGMLYRSSLLLEGEKELPYGFLLGAGARLNIANNLDKLRKTRFITPLSVRSNEVDFAEKRFSVDRFYGSWLRSVTDSTHVALTAGYLEEMYTGFGGEILYRPFGKTFAVGAEAWRTYKRDPDSSLARDYFNTPVNTAHLNLFYEVPNSDITTFAKVGQYLGTDRGATFGVQTRFDNGAMLSGSVTSTNLPIELFNGDRNRFVLGVNLTLPLGNLPFLPNGSGVRFNAGPMARDVGQVIDNPQPLYDVTEPIAYRQLSRSWGTLLE